MTNSFSSKIQGILSDPVFNMGLGLLASGGRREGLLTGMNQFRMADQIRQRREREALEEKRIQQQMEAQRQQMEARQRQQAAMQRLPEMMAMSQTQVAPNTGAVPDLSTPKPVYNVDQAKADMLRTGFEANPQLAGQMLQNQFLPGGGSNYGLSPVYARNPQSGQLSVYQLSQSGGDPRQVNFGGNVPVKPLQTMNLGGSQVQVDPYGRGIQQAYPVTPKPTETPGFRAGVKEAETRAQMETTKGIEARSELPGVVDSANDTIRLVNELIEHPGLEYSVGGFSLAPAIPGTSQADAITRIEQLQGKQFLAAFESLKGGGQITETEGKKAEQAIARMQRRVSKEDFVEASREFIGVLQKGIERSKAKAGVSSASPQETKKRLKYNPSTGEFE